MSWWWMRDFEQAFDEAIQDLGVDMDKACDNGTYPKARDRVADVVEAIVLKTRADFEEWRGTCKVEQDWDNDEPPQARWWKCDACGDRFVFERGFSPSYCPNCGRKVVK